MGFRVLIICAALLAGQAPATAASKGERSLTILYAGGWSHSLSTDLLIPLERLIQANPERMDLKGISFAVSYYSPGRYILNDPGETPKKELPALESEILSRRPVRVLESPLSVMAISSWTASSNGLLAQVKTVAGNRAEGWAYVPGVREKRAEMQEVLGPAGGRFRVLVLEDAPSEISWRVCYLGRYRVEASGEESEVAVIGKTVGGFHRVLPALKRRARELAGPALKLNFDEWIETSQWLSTKGLTRLSLDYLKGSGFEPWAFNINDLVDGGKGLAAASSSFTFIASNLEPLEGELALPLKRYVVKELAGVKVALFSVYPEDVDARLRRKNIPLRAADPIISLQDAIEDAVRTDQAELIVVQSYQNSEELARLGIEVPGIDILLGENMHERVVERSVTLELENWNDERLRRRPYSAMRNSYAFGELTLAFAPSDSGLELTRIVDRPGKPTRGILDADGALFDYMDEGLRATRDRRQPLLPDARRLWPDSKPLKWIYGPLDVFSLAAHVLRETSGSEVALTPVLRLQSNVTGTVNESVVRDWFSESSLGSPVPVVVGDLSGQALRHMLRRIDFTPIPEQTEALRTQRKYRRSLHIAAAGITRDGRISGLRLRDDELYSVAMTQDLLYTKELQGVLDGFKTRKERKRKLGPLVIDWLKKRREASREENERYIEEIREAFGKKIPERPVWRLHLKDVSFRFANTQVRNTAPFNQVRNARIRSLDQILVQARSHLLSELYWRDFRFNTGIKTDYGRVTLRPRNSPRVVNETQDQIIFDLGLGYRARQFGEGAWRHSVGPFLNLAYDTEFTKPDTLPRRKLLRISPGVRIFEGRYLREFRLSGVVESDFSTPATSTLYGWETGLAWESKIPRSPARLRLNVNYREFSRSRLDTLDDLRRELEVDCRFPIPLLGRLSFSPFINFYLFQGKLIRETGHNLVFGLSLAYSHLWKLSY